MTDTTSTGSDYNREALSAHWTAVPDDALGGWCVSIDGRTPAAGGRMAADVMTREVAEHIAALHNAALDGRLLPAGTETYERFGARISIDGQRETDMPASREQAEAIVEIHKAQRAANGWRGDAVLVRRFQHMTPFEPVEDQP